MTLQVSETAVGIPIVLGCAVIVVDGVALEPLLEPHRAHDVVVGHRVERVEGVLHSLLGRETHLEGSAHAGTRPTDIVEDLGVFEAPGLDHAGVGIVGLHDVVLLFLGVEEEDLRVERLTRL